MQITVDMPTVSKCSVTKCAYNVNQGCHAKAITVGDSSNPGCDTFFEDRTHTKATGTVAGVGACKVSICRHNQDFECTAQSISVGHADNGVKCLTFDQR